MPQLVIVADDLTGAADTGACFAAAGLGTVIRLSDTTVPNVARRRRDVVSTESRDLDGTAAAEAVRSALIAIGRRLRAMRYRGGSTRRSTPRFGVTPATSCSRRWKPLAPDAR